MWSDFGHRNDRTIVILLDRKLNFNNRIDLLWGYGKFVELKIEWDRENGRSKIYYSFFFSFFLVFSVAAFDEWWCLIHSHLCSWIDVEFNLLRILVEVIDRDSKYWSKIHRQVKWKVVYLINFVWMNSIDWKIAKE